MPVGSRCNLNMITLSYVMSVSLLVHVGAEFGRWGRQRISYMEELGYRGQVAREVALGPLRNSLTTPSDQHILGQTGVWVGDLDIGELDPTFGEFIDKVGQFPLCPAAYEYNGTTQDLRIRITDHLSFELSVHFLCYQHPAGTHSPGGLRPKRAPIGRRSVSRPLEVRHSPRTGSSWIWKGHWLTSLTRPWCFKGMNNEKKKKKNGGCREGK